MPMRGGGERQTQREKQTERERERDRDQISKHVAPKKEV
jgi:hypothetical protein